MVRKLIWLLLSPLLATSVAVAAGGAIDPTSVPRYGEVSFKLSSVGSDAATIPLFFLDSSGSPATGLSSMPCILFSPGNGTYACSGSISEVGDGVYRFDPTAGDIFQTGPNLLSVGAGMVGTYNANVIHIDVLPDASPVLTESCSNTNPGTNSLCSMVLGNTSRTGTAQTFTKSSLRMAASEAFATNELKDNFAIKILRATGGAGEGQIACICSNTGSTDQVYFCNEMQTLPTGTVTYGLISAPGCNKPLPIRRW
jgi:hypothetical protein